MVTNCAEFNSVNNALLNGAQIENLSVATVRTSTGQVGGRGTRDQRTGSVYQHFLSAIELAGLNDSRSYVLDKNAQPTASACWQRLHQALAKMYVVKDPQQPKWDAFSWRPLVRQCKSAPLQHIVSSQRRWPLAGKRLAEATSWGICGDEITKNRRGHVQVKFADQPWTNNTFLLPKRYSNPIGTKGPYLTMVVWLESHEDPKSKAIPHRLAGYAVYSDRILIPVESSYEREVCELLLRMRIPFTKPIFVDDFGFRPDFIIGRNQNYIIEVQGRSDQAYLDRKNVKLQDLDDHLKKLQKELILYGPPKEKIGVLEKRLLVIKAELV